MPTILRLAGLRVVIYPNDHRPAHVHVIGMAAKRSFRLVVERSGSACARIMASAVPNLRVSKASLNLISIESAGSGRTSMVSNDNFLRANRHGRSMRAKTPIVVGARYNPKLSRIVLSLSSGLDITFPPQCAEGLDRASSAELKEIEISPSGLGIYFPKLNVDLYVPALLEGSLGSRKWMAARLGAAGGSSTSSAKRRASRANGKLGGRPRRSAAG